MLSDGVVGSVDPTTRADTPVTVTGNIWAVVYSQDVLKTLL